MKVVFLDIDGVLNRHVFDLKAKSCNIEPACIEQFNRILAATEAKIVVSSAWRYLMLRTEDREPCMTTVGFEVMLRTHGVAGLNIIGHTCSDEENGWTLDNKQTCRGEQIRRWLKENRSKHDIERYVVLDDDDHGISEESLPFVQTNPNVGLDVTTADDVIRMLNME